MVFGSLAFRLAGRRIICDLCLSLGAFGYELITSDHDIITIKRSIFGHGPLKRFEISKISNLRASGFFATMISWSYNMAYWGLSGGTVAFDYENKPIRFGINLNEDDSKQLVVIVKIGSTYDKRLHRIVQKLASDGLFRLS